MVRPGKRYVLITWDGGTLSAEERKKLTRLLEQRGKVNLIPIDGWERSLVVKTDVEGAASIRDSFNHVMIGGRRVATVLTSGCIGNLKKRARESAATDLAEVPK